ncbi:MAG: hypothetical protein GYA35_06010 [Thermoanaerobaculaceae bacterium]|nr:hypothetical protein [Thermoanaerobaculaceae bacterium]
MKRVFFVVLLFVAFLVFGRIGGPSAIHGYITSIDIQKEITTATISVKDIPAAEIATKVKPGMSVKIIHSIETAQFRLPIGRILSVKDGIVTVAIDQSLLDKEFENPYTQEKIKVRTLFEVGAEVSISVEST